VNVLSVYIRALTSGQLTVVQYELFTPVFNAHLPPTGPGEAAAVLPNISHGVFAAVLVALLVSTYACAIVKSGRGSFTLIYRASIGCGGILIVLSLSRSVLLVAVVACLLPIVRRMIVGPIRASDIQAPLLVGVLVVLVAATPLLGFISKRVFSDTVSYSARGSAVGLAIDAIAASPLMGTNRYAGVTREQQIRHPESVGAHNFVLEAAVTGGMLTGSLALIVFVIALRDVIRGFGAYLRDRSLWAPVAGGAMALIWMFTVAELNQAEWMALALFYAATTRVGRQAFPST